MSDKSRLDNIRAWAEWPSGPAPDSYVIPNRSEILWLVQQLDKAEKDLKPNVREVSRELRICRHELKTMQEHLYS